MTPFVFALLHLITDVFMGPWCRGPINFLKRVNWEIDSSYWKVMVSG